MSQQQKTLAKLFQAFHHDLQTIEDVCFLPKKSIPTQITQVLIFVHIVNIVVYLSIYSFVNHKYSV